MQQKFFVKSFAEAGDREAVPNNIQTTGDVSYEQGYGYDYQRDQAIDPLAKPIERNKHNAILHDITEAVQQYQVFGTPEWITAEDNDGVPYPYARRAHVRYRASETGPWDVYESLVDNNTTEPSDATKWASVVSVVASQEQAAAGTDNSTIMTPLRVTQAIAASSSNVGQVGYFFRSSAPMGWLAADGAMVSRTEYAALWEAMGCPDTGDGLTTFTLPDLRGYFLRGLDLGAGRDFGRTLGSVQDSQNKAHAHAASASADGNHVHSAWTDEQGLHRHGVHDPGHNHGTEVPHGGGHAHFRSVVGPFGISGYYNTHHAHTGISIHDAGNHAHSVSIGDAGNHSHTITVNGDGGEEARPANIALLVCIKI
ncbi:phage tail protein [Mycetohabitans sp. B46]|uniref:phage tail protein n=1 Tax=Mycetohabitans sp. B46 TaxID=2772536 RepID=UPI00307D2812